MKRHSLLSLLTLLFFVSATTAFAQRTVTGTVISSSDGLPLIGASILVKGTGTGTVTDLDGTFSIEGVSNTDVLVISYTGYQTQEITVGAQTNISIVLK